jgi:23S rRNA pseudouridine1911/1915/1917 synthase
MEPGFEILYEQGPCLVVCKPPGLPTQAVGGIDNLEARIKAMLKQRDRLPGNVYLGIAHRLDRPASGAIVFGKHSRATRRLAEQFEGRLVRKIYWAGVEGSGLPAEGTWEDYVRKVPGEARAEIVPPDHPDQRRAVLHYRTLAAADGVTWLEIQLHTGRTHQIRIQAASRGYPVLGDAQYGATKPFGPQHEDYRLRAIALHARLLEFRDPSTRQMVAVTAPLPPFWPQNGW